MAVPATAVRPWSVVVPYTRDKGRLKAMQAIRRQRSDAIFFQIEEGDAYAYGRLLEQLWEEPTTTILIEHDVIPPRGSLSRLASCPQLMCTHRCQVHEGRFMDDTFGLIKFDALLKELYPGLAHAAASKRKRPYSACPWWSLASEFMYEARKRDLAPHVHEPNAEHLHDYSQDPGLG